MKRWMVRLAVRLVRSWTRAYTIGLGTEVRQRRCAEIESDIWESLHDQRDDTRLHILIRCCRGIPADIVWRLEMAGGGRPVWKVLTFLCITAVAAIAIVWSLAIREPLSLPDLPAAPQPNYVINRRMPPPPPPPPPTWEEFVAQVKGTRSAR
jgi:hypothetical protein